MDRKTEILEDLREFQVLLESSERPSIRSVLFNEMKNLSTELLKYLPSERPQTISYKPIEKWAWDQDKTHIRVYVTTLPDLKSHPKEKIILEYTKNSVSVAIHDLNGVNYKLRFAKLKNPIKKCRVNAKSNGFSITMEKDAEGDWDDLVFKKSIFDKDEEEEKKKKDEDSNVHEKFFKMMKNIYDEGDEKMKEEIGVPWMKAMAEVYRPITK